MKHCGIDVHSKYSEICVVDENSEVELSTRVRTTEDGLRRALGGYVGELQIVIEAGGESAWVSRCLEAIDFEVIVCNPSRMRLIAESRMKTDKVDAELLARLLRADLQLLVPSYHRSEKAQMELANCRARRSLVDARVKFSNCAKGLLRGFGIKVKEKPKGLPSALDSIDMPDELRSALEPLIEAIDDLNLQIERYDERIEALAVAEPIVECLTTIPGIGPLTALTFLLLVENPERFWRSRDVAAFFGLVPRHYASGDTVHRGYITKAGDPEMRKLLTQSAHALLRGPDTALKRWAEGLIERRGKKTAVVALARKLAVLMHRLWITGETFKAFPGGLEDAA